MIKRSEWILIIFNLLYVLPFTLYYLSIKNFEFLGYIALFLVIFAFIAGTLRKTKFDNFVLWGLSIWGLLHMAGGGVIVKGNVLYALQLIPIWVTENFYILKYDQFVHFYLYVFVAIAILYLLKERFKNSKNKTFLYLISGFAALGIGAGNEIVEFMMVLFLENTGVGGYYNTAWDLVFNTGGAILGVIIGYWRYIRNV